MVFQDPVTYYQCCLTPTYQLQPCILTFVTKECKVVARMKLLKSALPTAVVPANGRRNHFMKI